MNSTPSASRVACEPMTLVTAITRRAALAREPHRGQRVGGLARLGDADHEVAGADDRVAVAVLGRDVHLHRHARPLLDRVAADQAGVVGGAAGDDDDPAAVAQQLVVDAPGRSTPSGARRAVGDRLGHGVRLLVDLLEHERLVAALLGLLGVPVDRLDRRARRGAAAGGEELDAVGADDDDLVVLDELHAARVWARNAGMPEARNCSPSPRPTISGHSLRAPTTTPGSSAATATSA